jgi:signal transduction histidine kinase
MDEATVAKAYTPFFSAQAAGRRRGLGLPKARRIIENHGGSIWINSQPGRGTTVSVRLPTVPGDGDRQQRGDARSQGGKHTGGG